MRVRCAPHEGGGWDNKKILMQIAAILRDGVKHDCQHFYIKKPCAFVCGRSASLLMSGKRRARFNDRNIAMDFEDGRWRGNLFPLASGFGGKGNGLLGGDRSAHWHVMARNVRLNSAAQAPDFSPPFTWPVGGVASRCEVARESQQNVDSVRSGHLVFIAPARGGNLSMDIAVADDSSPPLNWS